MAKRMLIDATHPEETRVVVISGNRLEEFDFETSTKKLIKGNIYLAKVTRVEPSLQAAFVDYGGNRHGFLAFSEIHPDYYRLPVADREALMAAAAADHDVARIQSDEPAPRARQAEADTAHADRHNEGAEHRDGEGEQSNPDVERRAARLEDRLFASDAEQVAEAPAVAPAAPSFDAPTDGEADDRTDGDSRADAEHADAPRAEAAEPAAEAATSTEDQPQPESSVEAPPASAENELSAAPTTDADAADAGASANGDSAPTNGDDTMSPARADSPGEAAPQPETVSTIGGDEAEDEAEVRRPSRNFYRRYRIQEVVARRQILLVQVQKEERGNKGAALTTYISLAGRYCVLMPNTPRGGGVSRKITSQQDRKRLKSLIEDLEIPDGMAVIVRTAGMERTKAEIKRDYEYLVKLWDDIRERTMGSTAPALIYEEASLIKRAIRDVYSKEIDEILVEGEEGYKAAKGFMKLLMPSHAKRVQVYNGEGIPLFHRYQIESQLDSIHSPSVQLRSGGYIVMNSTEALVAVDVNSGRATRERNIEETAYRTNLEAADEIARQLRLRDLAGLIVIDFIDMEEHRNKANVERRLKDALRQDRARIQVGRISAFGLLEMSRQRLRPSLFESSTQVCQACGGTGFVRSTESTALHVMRAIEEEGMRRRSAELTVYVPSSVALYMLNQKRQSLAEIERRYDFNVVVATDDKLIPPAHRIERAALRGEPGQPVHALAHAELVPARSEESPRSEPARHDTRGEQAGPEAGRRDRGRNDGRRHDGPRRDGQHHDGPRHEGHRHDNQRHDAQRDEHRNDDQRATRARDDEAAQPGQQPGSQPSSHPDGEPRDGRRRRRRGRGGGEYESNQQRGPTPQGEPAQPAAQSVFGVTQPDDDAGQRTWPASQEPTLARHDAETWPADQEQTEPPAHISHGASADPMIDATSESGAADAATALSQSQDEHVRIDGEQRDGRRRRRGRRGGRRRRRGREDGPQDNSHPDQPGELSTDADENDAQNEHEPADTPAPRTEAMSSVYQGDPEPETQAPDRRAPVQRPVAAIPVTAAPVAREPVTAEPAIAEPAPTKPAPAPREPIQTDAPAPPPPAAKAPVADDPSRPKRSGWWQRLIE